MATIDELIVSLALDATKFDKGQKDAVSSLKKMEDASGHTSKQIETHGKVLSQAFSSLKNELLSVAAVFLSINGIKNFAQNAILSSAALDRTSNSLGLGASELAQWELAAKNAGGTAQSMTASIHDANDALVKMQTTGELSDSVLASLKYAGAAGVNFDLNEIKSGTDMLLKQADIVKGLQTHGYDINTARKAGSEMGLHESEFQLFKNGSDDLKKQLDAVKNLADEQANMASSSEKLRRQFDLLENKIEAGVLPMLSKFVDYLLSPEFKQSFDILKMEVDSIANAFKWLGEKIGTFFGFVNTGSVEQHQDKAAAKAMESAPMQTQVYARLKSLGWTPEQAAGMVGSLKQENGKFDPNATNSIGMYGLGQWNKSRRDDFKKWSGKDIKGSTWQEQVDFMNYELTQGKEKEAGKKIRETKTVADAAKAHRKYYERPGEAEANDTNRIKYAQETLSQAQKENIATQPTQILSQAQKANISNQALPLAFKNGGQPAGNQSTTDIKIGEININTPATDANGIASGIHNAVQKNINFGVPNATTGVN